MNNIEKAILDYLMSRNDGWKWMMGAKVYSKEETIRLFKTNKRFRKMIVEEVVKLATDLFTREKGGK